eukprot:264661_1
MAEQKEQKETCVLITGANRGLGFEFVQQLLSRDNYCIIACCRNPDKADALNALAAKNKDRITISKCDVTNDKDIQELSKSLGDKPIDILLLNAGIFGNTKEPWSRDDFLNVFNVNCVGPVMIAAALYDNVKVSKRKQIIAITSGAGSILDCGSGYYPYRVSKAAMNMGFQRFAKKSEKDKDGVTTLLVNPGWVQTDMGGKNATKSTQDSIKEMLDNVIDKYESLINGGFYTYTGKPFAEDKIKDAKFAW